MSAPPRVVVATAGHVDHGKTALIRALTGTDTDRLPEEKRRGISIELGFAQLADAGVSFIDVPGHKKLVHAMIAGVGGVDAALLVVAADDGVMPQTREHLWICALLGIDRVLVALTKADLVDAETLELAHADVASALEALGLAATRVVATSALSGQGIAELRSAIVELAGSIPARGDSARTFIGVDRVFSVKGAGTVVTGTLTRGRLTVGETLYVASEQSSIEASCRALEIHGQAVNEARAPTRVAVNLARIELASVRRGDVLTRDPELCRTRHFDMTLRAVPGAEKDLAEGSSVIVHCGTTRRSGRVTPLGEGALHVALDSPLACEGGVGVVLRGFRSTREHGAVLGGGRIVDARSAPPPKRRDPARREQRAALVRAAGSGELGEALGQLLELAEPRPIAAGDVERRFGLEPGEVARQLTGKRRKGPADAMAIAGGELFSTGRLVERLEGELVTALGRHHAAHLHERGMSIETARSRLALRTGRELAGVVLARALANGVVRQVDESSIALPDFAMTAGARTAESSSLLFELIDQSALEGVSETALPAKSALAPGVIKTALAELATSGRARRLGGIWFAERHLEKLRQLVRDHLARHGSLTVPVFKEIAGVSRKQAIPLLEQLDREGTTRRQGDLRVLGARASGS